MSTDLFLGSTGLTPGATDLTWNTDLIPGEHMPDSTESIDLTLGEHQPDSWGALNGTGEIQHNTTNVGRPAQPCHLQPCTGVDG